MACIGLCQKCLNRLSGKLQRRGSIRLLGQTWPRLAGGAVANICEVSVFLDDGLQVEKVDANEADPTRVVNAYLQHRHACAVVDVISWAKPLELAIKLFA